MVDMERARQVRDEILGTLPTADVPADDMERWAVAMMRADTYYKIKYYAEPYAPKMHPVFNGDYVNNRKASTPDELRELVRDIFYREDKDVIQSVVNALHVPEHIAKKIAYKYTPVMEWMYAPVVYNEKEFNRVFRLFCAGQSPQSIAYILNMSDDVAGGILFGGGIPIVKTYIPITSESLQFLLRGETAQEYYSDTLIKRTQMLAQIVDMPQLYTADKFAITPNIFINLWKDGWSAGNIQGYTGAPIRQLVAELPGAPSDMSEQSKIRKTIKMYMRGRSARLIASMLNTTPSEVMKTLEYYGYLCNYDNCTIMDANADLNQHNYKSKFRPMVTEKLIGIANQDEEYAVCRVFGEGMSDWDLSHQLGLTEIEVLIVLYDNGCIPKDYTYNLEKYINKHAYKSVKSHINPWRLPS